MNAQMRRKKTMKRRKELASLAGKLHLVQAR